MLNHALDNQVVEELGEEIRYILHSSGVRNSLSCSGICIYKRHSKAESIFLVVRLFGCFPICLDADAPQPIFNFQVHRELQTVTKVLYNILMALYILINLSSYINTNFLEIVGLRAFAFQLF